MRSAALRRTAAAVSSWPVLLSGRDFSTSRPERVNYFGRWNVAREFCTAQNCPLSCSDVRTDFLAWPTLKSAGLAS